MVALVLVVLLGLLIVYRGIDKPFGFELEWMEELVENRNPFWTGVALTFNYLGGGITAILVVPLLIIGWPAAVAAAMGRPLLRDRHPRQRARRPALKKLIGRSRPDEILVNPDFGSFPSGHSANAALIATALGIVFWRAWIWVAGAIYTVAMMLSRTYLGRIGSRTRSAACSWGRSRCHRLGAVRRSLARNATAASADLATAFDRMRHALAPSRAGRRCLLLAGCAVGPAPGLRHDRSRAHGIRMPDRGHPRARP